MTWTAPMTAVAGAVFTAAQFNQSVRDNLNQTAPALATAAGQWFVSTAANAIAARSITSAIVATSEATASTSYTALATPGPAVSVVTGGQALVSLYAAVVNSTTGLSLMSFAVSGATTITAADNTAIGGATGSTGMRVGGSFIVTGLTPGTNTFTAQYKVSAGTGTFVDRKLLVMAL